MVLNTPCLLRSVSTTRVKLSQELAGEDNCNTQYIAVQSNVIVSRLEYCDNIAILKSHPSPILNIF